MCGRVGLISLLFLLSGCIEPFDPEIDSYDNILVVEGQVSNDKPAAKVKLSRTYSYEKDLLNPESSALAVLRDINGAAFELTETEPGIYTYASSDLIVNAGDLFKLLIITADGEEYESDFVSVIESPPLDSTYYIDFRNNAEASETGVEGVDFYINARGGQEGNKYYKWEWEESWKILSPINYPEVEYCWQYDQSTGIHIETTENLSDNTLEDYFLFNVSFKENKLAIEYSVLVKQYALDRNNYVFLTKLQKINQGSGGFFDPIPAALQGNINCISDPDKPVLGFFEASTVNANRIFIKRSDLKPGSVSSGFEDCELLYVSISDYSKGEITDYYYVYEFYDSTVEDTLVVMTNKRECYDCSIVGETEKPGFWHD